MIFFCVYIHEVTHSKLFNPRTTELSLHAALQWNCLAGCHHVAYWATNTQHDDCGLLAIRNATLDDSLNLDGLLSVVRPLQKDLEESVVSADTNFLEEGTGNFNGIGLMHYLESRGYACVLGRTHMSDLLELLCLSLTSRVVGVVWHEGSKTTGHWLCARLTHTAK